MIMLLTIITIHTANEKWNFLTQRWKKMYVQGLLNLLSSYLIEMLFRTVKVHWRLLCTLHQYCNNEKKSVIFFDMITPNFTDVMYIAVYFASHKMVWFTHSMSLQLFILNHTNTWSRVFENRIKWNSVQNNFWHDVICQEFTWSILLWFWIIGNKYVTL